MKLQPIKFAGTIVLLVLFAVFLSSCSPAAKKARILERADRYFKAGEYDKAKVEYMNLLRVDHQDVRAFQQLGFIWSEQGVPLRAIPFLVRVRELAPQNVAARSKLALGLLSLGERADARKEALSILQQDSSNTDAIIILADTSQTKEEISATEQELDKFPNKNTAAFHLARASLVARKGDVGAVSEEVEEALRIDPKLARAHLAMGYMYLLRKNSAHAAPELKAAAELSPPRSEERIKYAEFQVANKQVDAAKAQLENITKHAPDYIPAWRVLAQISLIQKKYDEALSRLENVFSRDSENPEGRMLQATIYVAKGDPAKAIATLDKLNTAYPSNPSVKFQLARAYLANKDAARSRAALEQAIATKPDFVEAKLALAELNLRSGKAQALVGPMEELLKKRPDLSQARALLADAYRSLGKLDQAAALFREQIAASPNSADAHLILGIILREQNQNEDARKEFEKAGELAPDNLLPVDQLVDLDLRAKQFESAQERVAAILKRVPDFAPGHVLQGKVFTAQGKWDAAEAEFKKAIELSPNYAPAYDLLVQVYVRTNKVSQAVTELKEFLSKQPENAQARMVLATLYDRLNDYSQARDAYEKVLAKNPDFVLALNNLAYIYTNRLKDLQRAYDLASKARNLQPNDPSVADTLGWVLCKRGDYQQALPLLQESVSKLSDNAEVQFHLGMAAYMMGQADVARVALEKAAKSTVDFPGKDEAQRRLASLQTGSAHLETHESSDLLALTRRAEDLEKRGQHTQAAHAYEEALRLNPKLGNLALKLAQLYAGPLRDRDKALEFAKRARALAPNDPDVSVVLGRIAVESGNFSWAFSLLQESARKGASDPAVLHDFAVAAYALGKVPEARQAMQRVVDLDPNSARADEAKRFLSMTPLDQPSPEAVAAQPEVEKILKTQPDYVPALMARAASQLQRNDRGAATEIYSKVLQEYPDFAPAQKRLAAIYAENPSNLAKAYDFAIKARKNLPDDADLALTLAEISYQRKEFPYAIQLFKESAAKQPLVAKDLFYLGMAQLQARQAANGRETLDRALKAGLSGSFADEAKKRLEEKQPK